jgi:hypothetical protein
MTLTQKNGERGGSGRVDRALVLVVQVVAEGLVVPAVGRARALSGREKSVNNRKRIGHQIIRPGMGRVMRTEDITDGLAQSVEVDLDKQTTK